MKKVLPVLVLLVFLAVGVFFFINKNSIEKFSLLKEQGIVSYKFSQDDQYAELNSEDIDLKPGTYIKTGDNASAQVLLPNNSMISLDANTEVQINYTKKSTSINQFLGNSWNRVKGLSKNESYEVVTPNTIAAVRGTIFGVDLMGSGNDVQSGVFVQEHEVEVSKYEGSGQDKKIQSGTNIAEGKFLRVDLKNNFEPENIPTTITTRAWFIRNKALDKDYLEFRGLKAKLFRQRLRDRLKQRIESQRLSSNTGGNYLSQFQNPAYNIADYRETICASSQAGAYSTYIQSLQMYKDQLGPNYDQIVAYFTSIENYCADGKLDDNEYSQLLQLSQSFSSTP